MKHLSLFYDLVEIRKQTTSRSKRLAVAYKGYAKAWNVVLSLVPSHLIETLFRIKLLVLFMVKVIIDFCLSMEVIMLGLIRVEIAIGVEKKVLVLSQRCCG